jgi:ATP-dependent helicase/nuclease subunit A
MSDHRERQRALDPATSFIVRAPAGSGKTGLLIFRILRLLATVDEPEEILATTFTRKAAAEMRHRVLDQLRKATLPAPGDDFAKQGWELARAALDRDQQRQWGLLDSPSRLRIQTLDSFEATLVARLPWLAQWGVHAGVTEQALPIYQDAVQAALRAMAGASPEREDPTALPTGLRSLIRLLNLRGNRLDSLSTMLVKLAERRDE